LINGKEPRLKVGEKMVAKENKKEGWYRKEESLPGELDLGEVSEFLPGRSQNGKRQVPNRKEKVLVRKE